mmetsp:Transcript_23463/g.70487  ORF Transcript_23463/g.70487 Transcript_23463/m.70487 type:complete len:209 (-) Transcript_23463:657-1283(-)
MRLAGVPLLLLRRGRVHAPVFRAGAGHALGAHVRRAPARAGGAAARHAAIHGLRHVGGLHGLGARPHAEAAQEGHGQALRQGGAGIAFHRAVQGPEARGPGPFIRRVVLPFRRHYFDPRAAATQSRDRHWPVLGESHTHEPDDGPIVPARRSQTGPEFQSVQPGVHGHRLRRIHKKTLGAWWQQAKLQLASGLGEDPRKHAPAVPAGA